MIDPEEGFRFHMMAAEQHNHVEALYNVGNSYFQGVVRLSVKFLTDRE